MLVLDDAVLNDSYDVVVVGSGLAGLTAAALIAKRGLRTLLVEHHYFPGGMCTTLRREGFSFDTGTALLYGFGERGMNPHRFVMNELGADIDIIEHRALLRMRLPDKQIVFWPDYERFVAELVSAFPNQASQIRGLYDYLHRLYTDVVARRQLIVPPSEIPFAENLRTLLRHPVAMLQALKMLDTSTASVLSRFISNPELVAFFDKLTSTYVYCTTEETPAILAAAMFIDNHVGGAYYPARSPQVLASTLEKAFEGFGGQTLYGYRVDEILIEGGAAVGVRLGSGETIAAQRVVANTTVWNLYDHLILPEHVKPERREWARRQVPTLPSVVLYIGVAAEAIPEGTLPVEMLVADTRGVNGGDVTMYISSLDDPSICPPGTHAVTVIAPSLERWPHPGEPAYKSAQYREQKQAAAERVLDQIELSFPGFRRHIRVLEVGTPSTIERYTLKNGGAVGGPKQCIGQQLLKRLHARSEWRNLYVCGDSTVMGMGTPAVTVSGVGAANRVLEDTGLPRYRRRRFERDVVHLVKGAALSPLPDPSQPIDIAAAVRLARECDYCESPGCTKACPAGIDMRNVMRRVEAGNSVGAARAMREVNPLSEVCGHLCQPNPPCEARCNHLAYASRPVSIAALQAFVCREAGEDGWSKAPRGRHGAKAAIVGAGAAGLTCAYYLARAGCEVVLLDRDASPGAGLRTYDPSVLPAGTVDRELRGLLTTGVDFRGGMPLEAAGAIRGLSEKHDAVYLATGAASLEGLADLRLTNNGDGTWFSGNIVAGGGLMRGQCSVVRAVADGRRAAQSILELAKRQVHEA